MSSLVHALTALLSAILSALLKIDIRAWFTVALFGLVWRIIEIIAANPALLANASFMQLVGPICGAGGLLLIASFLFASNKESAQKTAALADNARNMREAGLPVGGRRADDAPIDVKVVNPYADKTDDDLRQILLDRGQDGPAQIAAMDHPTMLSRLAELDAQMEPAR